MEKFCKKRMAIKTQYYKKDDSQPFIFLSDIDTSLIEPLATYCLETRSSDNLRWDGNRSFAGSHWWTFPYCFRYTEYRQVLETSTHYRIEKIKTAYQRALPIIEYIESLCSNFEIFYAEINYINSGKSIKPHIDNGDGLDGHHWYLGSSKRLHVPLVTNQEAIMYCGGEKRNLPVGSIYEFHNNLPHWVENKGTTPRIHFVLDLVPKIYKEDIDHFLQIDPFVKSVHISQLK